MSPCPGALESHDPARLAPARLHRDNFPNPARRREGEHMTLPTHSTVESLLPVDAGRALLIGRVWLPGVGPVVVAVRDRDLVDVSELAPTASELLEIDDLPVRLRALAASAPRVCPVAAAAANADERRRDAGQPWLLAPCDLQVIKASGVTFIDSLLERVIEEQARGDPSKALAIRQDLAGVLGDDLAGVVPGSAQAARIKQLLIARGAWSQYLEVGIGPDAEVFTKGPVLSAVGAGADIGLHPDSRWNNPEPEIVLAVNSRGRVQGATLGNDVNLRDFEGRSALLLGKAKDNNASTAIGPYVRVFDAAFGIDDVRRCELALEVEGEDGFVLQGHSSLSRISRDPLALVAQTIGAHHAYPDGFMLFLGTMFAPVQDRHGPGQGFTHAPGDVVRISTPALGALVNRVTTSDRAPRWEFGIAALMRNLASRGLLGKP
jgi:fumarylacetoacetate (FAA) hydrolase family protein